MNKPFRVCLLPVLLASGICNSAADGRKRKRSAANEGLKLQIDAVTKTVSLGSVSYPVVQTLKK